MRQMIPCVPGRIYVCVFHVRPLEGMCRGWGGGSERSGPAATSMSLTVQFSSVRVSLVEWLVLQKEGKEQPLLFPRTAPQMIKAVAMPMPTAALFLIACLELDICRLHLCVFRLRALYNHLQNVCL